jgi:hypothetical protein
MEEAMKYKQEIGEEVWIRFTFTLSSMFSLSHFLRGGVDQRFSTFWVSSPGSNFFCEFLFHYFVLCACFLEDMEIPKYLLNYSKGLSPGWKQKFKLNSR